MHSRTTQAFPARIGVESDDHQGRVQPHDEAPDEGRVDPEEPEAAKCPPCPHEKILAMYHEALPMLPRAVTWGDERQKFLRARWRETWERLRKLGKPHAIDDLLAWWRAYFARVRASPFLIGQELDRHGKPFFADLEWLVRPTNYAKVLDGKFLDRRYAA